MTNLNNYIGKEFNFDNGDFREALESEGIYIEDYEVVKIISLSIDLDSFDRSYWDIQLEDGTEFYGISGTNLKELY